MTDTNGPQVPTNNPLKYVRVVGDQLLLQFTTGRMFAVPSTVGTYLPINSGLVVTDPPPSGGGTPDPGTPPADDYPYATYPIGQASPFLFFYRECVDFCAWRIRNRTARTTFDNYYKGVRWGNANNWDNAALQTGIRLDSTPAVGAVAHKNTGTYGHVAWVYAVNADGTFNVEEYNWGTPDHVYGIRDNLTLANSGFTGFIHFEDAP